MARSSLVPVSNSEPSEPRVQLQSGMRWAVPRPVPNAANPPPRRMLRRFSFLKVSSSLVTSSVGGLLLGLVFDKQFRKLLLQGINLRTVANLNIRIAGIVVGVVLMVILGSIERLKRRHFSHYGDRKSTSLN